MKRLLACLLVALMLLPCLAGCGNTPAPTPDSPSTTPPEEGDGPTTPTTPTDVTFAGNFKVAGDRANLLTAALAEAGIPMGDEQATMTIYIGESDAAVTVTAKAAATAREAHYNDYALICDGTALAVYGASEHATTQAISYLIDHYASEGAITVKKDLQYTAQPTVVDDITVGDYKLQELTVVAQNTACLGIANTFAKRLSILIGYEIPVSTSPTRRAIHLRASNIKDEADFATAYHIEATANAAAKTTELTITAPTRASLSYATQALAAGLKAGDSFAIGAKEDRSFNLVHTDATDTALFKYCGTWQASDEEASKTMVSYWNAAYVEINFTGNAITPVFSKESTFKVKLDNADEYSKTYTVTGAITFFAEGDGEHTLKIFYNDKCKHMYFAGVSVSEGVTLSRTASRAHYIQFVGDSISDGGSSFTQLVGDVLGWDYSVAALSGIALETGYGYWRNNNGYANGTITPGSLAEQIKKNFGIDNIGMEDAFFKLGVANTAGTPKDELAYYAENYYTEKMDNRFACGNTPDIVFIFLGTNDELVSLKEEERFVNTYVNFVKNILSVYGNDTQICVLQALTHSSLPNNENHPRYSIIRSAADALMLTYPENITFIDRDIITTWNVEIGSDNTHPTAAGHATLTEKIAALLAEYYGK